MLWVETLPREQGRREGQTSETIFWPPHACHGPLTSLHTDIRTHHTHIKINTLKMKPHHFTDFTACLGVHSWDIPSARAGTGWSGLSLLLDLRRWKLINCTGFDLCWNSYLNHSQVQPVPLILRYSLCGSVQEPSANVGWLLGDRQFQWGKKCLRWNFFCLGRSTLRRCFPILCWYRPWAQLPTKIYLASLPREAQHTLY